MIVKRLGAIALAVVLILGAWVIRDRVIEDNGGRGDDDPPRTNREIVCVSDLGEACDEVAETLEIEIRVEDAATTLDALAALEDPSDAPVWITMAPFPAMVDNLREIGRRPIIAHTETSVASSPIALVALDDRASALTTACGEPLDWRCVGDAAGSSWEEIGGDASWREVRPAFAPIDSAIGLLGVADAVSGYFGSRQITTNDLEFTRWASDLAEAVLTSARPTVSAIATIQTRSSALDIAVGATAELSATAVDRFALQYADPMIRADVVVVVPEGASTPSGLTDELARVLEARGWNGPATEPNPLPLASEMFAIREAWKGFL